MAKQRYDEALLLRVRTLESKRRYKSAEFWKHADGLPYKVSRIIFYISLLPLLFWQFIYFFANPYSQLTKNSEFSDWRRNMTIIALTTAALLAAFVLSLFKKFLPALVLCVTTAVATNLFFSQALQIGASNSSEVTEVGSHVGKLVVRHLLPSVILCIAMLIPFLIQFFDRKGERAAYDHAASKLYEKFRRQQEEAGMTADMMSQEQWAQLVKEYGGETHYGRLKRSLKDAKRKQLKEHEHVAPPLPDEEEPE